MNCLLGKVLLLGLLPGASGGQVSKGTSFYDLLMKRPAVSDGLTLELRVALYRGPGGFVTDDLVLRNLGGRDIVIDNRIQQNANAYLYVFNSRNEIVPYKDWTLRAQLVSPQKASDLTTIKAGQSYGAGRVFSNTTLAPGDYTLIAVYGEGAGRGDSPFADKFWQGFVRTAPTLFHMLR